ncbi:MAG: hypothetical protein IPO88_24855 [Nannocystis sp.]|uniref:hypothetical protein n=1 Tax=Nannocystis sp. TaxID=1962667 RepID=UPI002425F013|nr:hypothetical protein [Nannocystis sp.]MBK9756672.1 hypothetical protein [Nannocystis sp.]
MQKPSMYLHGLWLLAACSEPASPPTGDSGDSSSAASTPTTAAASSSAADTTSETTADTNADTGEDTGQPVDPNLITHYFGAISLLPHDDNVSRCASWRLDNDQPLYVQSVLLDNEGSFHHSNWIVVPEDDYPGPDGYWNCADRGFEEIGASMKGTVLFAQSTQSFHEEQKLSAGSVVKIPPRHKIVGLLHTLNTSPREYESGLWLSLRLIHPKDVVGVVTPLSMQYKAIDIPGLSEARFTGKCDLSLAYGLVNPLQPLALRLHYILPHYHYLGNYFDVTVIGGLLDGKSVYNHTGFSGEGNGLTFDPPLDLPGATGLQFTCGYDNWRNQSVQWGNGDGEMCVMLALVEMEAKMGASVDTFNTLVDAKDGILYYEGLCLAAGVAKNENQGMPSDAEITGEMYLPPTDPNQQDVPPLPSCHDADDTVPGEAPTTLTSLRDTIFAPGCTFSACHGKTAIAGLDLQATDLHAELMNHKVVSATDMPLVKPGDPDNSWLYQVLARCEPKLSNGGSARHMPLNAPILLDARLVAKLRAWIEAGAKDD